MTHPEQLYPLILDSITDGVFTVDGDFRITSLNAEAERITGIRRDEAIGRRCYEVLRGSACQRGCPLRLSVETGEAQRDVRVTMLNADMDPIPISVSTAVMKDEDSGLVGGVEVFRDISELESLRDQLSGRTSFGSIVGQSRAMQDLYRLITDVATTSVSVLIQGESGTGKELVARTIHELSARSDKPFVTVNCGALPDTLFESELFGYERGAFTDAQRDKPGRFVQANGGTLLLDEVGELSPACQVKLLRALQEGEVTPLGSTKTIAVDVRVLAATNRNLSELIAGGAFRSDLYYRLCVVPIEIPPLRERREDVVVLVEHLLPLVASQIGKPVRQLVPAALTALYDYSFPGNVRELRNILERALVVCHGEHIELQHLPPALTSPPSAAWAAAAADGRPELAAPGGEPDASEESWWRLKPSERKLLAASPRGFGAAATAARRPEARVVLDALNTYGWNRAVTARALGISRSTLWRRMKEYGLAARSPEPLP